MAVIHTLVDFTRSKSVVKLLLSRITAMQVRLAGMQASSPGSGLNRFLAVSGNTYSWDLG